MKPIDNEALQAAIDETLKRFGPAFKRLAEGSVEDELGGYFHQIEDVTRERLKALETVHPQSCPPVSTLCAICRAKSDMNEILSRLVGAQFTQYQFKKEKLRELDR